MSIRNFFALLFILSLGMFLYFQYAIQTAEPQPAPIEKRTHTHQKSSPTASVTIETDIQSDNAFIMIASLITSVLSFLGFVISTYLSLRGHHREQELHSLQVQRERLEMEKIQQEVTALKEQNNIR